MSDLPFRTVWLSGASTGIGRAVARELAARGAQVAASARDTAALATLAEETRGLAGTVHPFALDVTDAAAVAATAEAVAAAVGPIDLLIANAGVSMPWDAARADADAFRGLFEVNVMGVVNMLAAAVPGFVGRGRGQVAIVSSVAGYRGLPTAAPYCASKAALIALAESLRLDLGPRGIRVQVVNPGFVRTPLTAKNRFRMPFLLEPEDAARRFVDGLCTSRFEITFPRRFTWLVKFGSRLPYGLYFRMYGRFRPAR